MQSTQNRNSSMSYGVMVIDMGVHELDALDEPVNITQVGMGGGGGEIHTRLKGVGTRGSK